MKTHEKKGHKTALRPDSICKLKLEDTMGFFFRLYLFLFALLSVCFGMFSVLIS